MRQLHGIGIGRARRDDRAGARDAKTIQQHGMVEKIAGQAGARPPAMLFEQARRCFRPPQDTANSCRACRRRCRAARPAISGRRRHRGWRDRRARRARSHRFRSIRRSGRSISHSSIEVEAAVLPRPGNSRSMMTTSRPCRVRRSATSDPVMPAPTISASHLRFSPRSRRGGCDDVANHGERPPRRSACSVSSESRMLIANL